jgi:hypothetical protein
VYHASHSTIFVNMLKCRMVRKRRNLIPISMFRLITSLPLIMWALLFEELLLRGILERPSTSALVANAEIIGEELKKIPVDGITVSKKRGRGKNPLPKSIRQRGAELFRLQFGDKYVNRNSSSRPSRKQGDRIRPAKCF